MGRRPLPAVRHLTRAGRWSTYDVSVRKKICAQTGYPLKLPSPTNLARLGHFPPASQAGRLAGPVFYVYLWSQPMEDPFHFVLNESPFESVSTIAQGHHSLVSLG
jgi:hypothetical protein